MNNLTKLDLSNMSIMPSSTGTILFSMLLAFATGLFIFWVYKMNYKGVMYSQNFALTLVLMTLITTPVVMCIRKSRRRTHRRHASPGLWSVAVRA